MNEVERWLYLDGPEPELLRPLLDALRTPPVSTPADEERRSRAILARIDAYLPPAEEPEPPPPPPPLTVTALALEIPPEVRAQLGRLPFRAPLPADAEKVRTLQTPVMRRPGYGETAPVGDDAIEKARTALPFAGSTAPAPSAPQLTLEQHASLSSEIQRGAGAGGGGAGAVPDHGGGEARHRSALDRPARRRSGGAGRVGGGLSGLPGVVGGEWGWAVRGAWATALLVGVASTKRPRSAFRVRIVPSDPAPSRSRSRSPSRCPRSGSGRGKRERERERERVGPEATGERSERFRSVWC